MIAHGFRMKSKKCASSLWLRDKQLNTTGITVRKFYVSSEDVSLDCLSYKYCFSL